MYSYFSRIKDMYLLLTLLSLSFMIATDPPEHKELDEEMRGYVKYSAEFLGYNPDLFSSHVTPTSAWASFNRFNNGWSSFYIVTFDRDFVERQPTHIKKAIAAHEVGHGYYPCAVLSYKYRNGLATYLEKENCADLVSAVIFNYEWTMEGLQGIKNELPDAKSIDDRIKLLREQLGPQEEDLTYWDE